MSKNPLAMEMIEYIGIPFTVFVLKLLLRNEEPVTLRIICSLLLAVQIFLLGIKIIYYGPLVKSFAQYFIPYIESPISANCSACSNFC